jgi:hypothetical protein
MVNQTVDQLLAAIQKAAADTSSARDLLDLAHAVDVLRRIPNGENKRRAVVG